MHDLNDLYFFAKVIDHGGFAAAERALGVPKSKLSRRVAQLEADLGVKLLQRSRRRFAITELGTSVYRHSKSVLANARAAYEEANLVNGEPRGLIRVSAPASVTQQYIPRILPGFLSRFPAIRVQFLVCDRRVDLINEGIDVALDVRSATDSAGTLVMRSLCNVQERLVASPDYLDRAGRPCHPLELSNHVALSTKGTEAKPNWALHDRNGVMHTVDLMPRVTGLDASEIMTLSEEGVGIAALPEHLCAASVRTGALEIVLPQWHLTKRTLRAFFPSRRGLLPAVRVFIDSLAETAPGLLESEPLTAECVALSAA